MKNRILLLLMAMSMMGTVIAQFGTLDPTFNAHGIGPNGDIYALAVQPDGKIFAGGTFQFYQGQPKKHFVRLNQNGSLDTTITVQFDNVVRQIIILPNGKILVAGTFINCITSSGTIPIAGVVRLNADGSFDTTFNNGGAGVNQSVHLGQMPIVNSMKVLNDGKIIIAGDFVTYNGTTARCIARLNEDGTLDNTFNAGGTGTDIMVDALAIQADGKILVGGPFTEFNGTPAGRLMRLNANGSRDNTFNTGGAGLSGSGYISTYIMRIQPDEKILVGGSFNFYNGTPLNHLIRLNTDGSIDNTFNPGGAGPSDPAHGLAVLPDNRILISGQMTSYNGTNLGRIACLNTDGTLDNSFNTGGTGANATIFPIALTNNNKIVIGGDFNSYNSTNAYRITRLNSAACTPSTGTDTQTACGSYTWINGVTYVASNNTATDTIVGGAANGCDSIVTLNLTINQPATGIDTQTACGSYTWINGVTYIASNNTATDTIVGGAANGCDSIVTLNLTINQATTGIDTQTACGSYTWINGVTYTVSNTTATDTIVSGAANGCDSIVTLNLTINTINTTVTHSALTMEAQLTGAAYQWINCATNAPISGATGRTYTATANGSYAVIINQNNCLDTSNCIQIANVGLEELAGWNTVLYPNPSNGQFTINWGIETDNMIIEITDVTGKQVYHSKVSGTVSHVVDMKEANGIYYTTLSNGTQRQVIKVILD
ncbi:hypothetical protein D3C87_196820 [compost metagenome]